MRTAMQGWLVGWSLTSLFSTNTAISETTAMQGLSHSKTSTEKYLPSDYGIISVH